MTPIPLPIGHHDWEIHNDMLTSSHESFDTDCICDIDMPCSVQSWRSMGGRNHTAKLRGVLCASIKRGIDDHLVLRDDSLLD